jgi:hypothetical protein
MGKELKDADVNMETEKTGNTRKITVEVEDNGKYTLALGGSFNVIELHNIIQSIHNQVSQDYRNYMESQLFEVVGFLNSLTAQEEKKEE